MNVISQSDIIRFLVPKMDQFVSLFDSTAEELGLGMHPPITISSTEPAIKALRLIGTHRISALAVVDENGKLVGNLSASDLKVRFVRSFARANRSRKLFIYIYTVLIIMLHGRRVL